MGEEAIEAEVWRPESNEWVDLAHPEKLKPKPKEAKAKNPLFTSNPSRVSGIGEIGIETWEFGSLGPSPSLCSFPTPAENWGLFPDMVNRGSLDWGCQDGCHADKGGEMKWTHVYKVLRPLHPPPQNAGSQASTLRAGDWKGFLWGIWPAQEERLEDTDIRVSPTKQLISIQESHSQQVPSLTKSFQWAFGPLLLHSSWPPRIITYMTKLLTCKTGDRD